MQQTFYYHGKTTDGHRFTIAARVKQKKLNIPKRIRFQLGATICNPIDQFRRAVGRAKAAGRIEAKNGSIGKSEVKLKGTEDSLIRHFLNYVIKYNDMNSKHFQKEFNLYTIRDVKKSI